MLAICLLQATTTGRQRTNKIFSCGAKLSPPKKKGSMNFQLLNAYLKCEVSYCSCHCQEFKQNNSYCISQGTGNRSVGIRLSLFFRQTFSDCRLYLKEREFRIHRQNLNKRRKEKKKRGEESREEKPAA